MNIYPRRFICPFITYFWVGLRVQVWNTTGVSSGAGTACHSGPPAFVPVLRCLCGVSADPAVELHVVAHLASCCDVRCDFHVKTMFDSSLLPLVLEKVHIWVMVFVVFWHILMSNTFYMSGDIPIVAQQVPLVKQKLHIHSREPEFLPFFNLLFSV